MGQCMTVYVLARSQTAALVHVRPWFLVVLWDDSDLRVFTNLGKSIARYCLGLCCILATAHIWVLLLPSQISCLP
jgi:hypothetical protein